MRGLAIFRSKSGNRTILAGACVAAAAACSQVQTTEPGTVGVTRTQSVSPLVSTEQLEEGSRQAYAQVIGAAKGAGKLNADPAQAQRVRRIVERLVPAATVFREDIARWNWEANVIESPEINAWAMPGGKIAVYSGIIEKLDLSDAELAAIVGHEIAHVLREHGRERASRATTQQLAINVLGGLAGLGQGSQDLANMAAQVAFALPNSRVQETEADKIGIELMARAGYDPRAAVSLWQKMQQAAGGQGPPEFLSTHPQPEDRIAELRQLAERVMPLYQQASR